MVEIERKSSNVIRKKANGRNNRGTAR
jgi:hypothetical protein